MRRSRDLEAAASAGMATWPRMRATPPSSPITGMPRTTCLARSMPRLRAAQAAEASYAFPEALAWYERALELWDRVPERSPKRAAIGWRCWPRPQGSRDSAILPAPWRILRSALALVDEAREPVRAAMLHVRLGRAEWINGQGDLALQAHRTAVRLVPSGRRRRHAPGRSPDWPRSLNLQDRYAESRPLAEEAVELARAAVPARSRAMPSTAARSPGAGRARSTMPLPTSARRSPSPRPSGTSTTSVGRTPIGSGSSRSAVASRKPSARVRGRGGRRRLGFLAFLGTHLLCNAADLLFSLGRWDESEAAVRQVEADRRLRHQRDPGPRARREARARSRSVRGRRAGARAIAPRAARTMDRQCIGPCSRASRSWRSGGIDPRMRWTRHARDRAVGHGALMTLAPLLRSACARARISPCSARARRSEETLADADRQGDEIPIRRGGSSGSRGRAAVARTQSAAWSALSEAEWSRLEGHLRFRRLGTRGRLLGGTRQPYPAAYARYREAEALLAARADRRERPAALAQAIDDRRPARRATAPRGGRGARARARIAIGEPAAAREPTARAEIGAHGAHGSRGRGPGARRRWPDEPADRRSRSSSARRPRASTSPTSSASSGVAGRVEAARHRTPARDRLTPPSPQRPRQTDPVATRRSGSKMASGGDDWRSGP